MIAVRGRGGRRGRRALRGCRLRRCICMRRDTGTRLPIVAAIVRNPVCPVRWMVTAKRCRGGSFRFRLRRLGRCVRVRRHMGCERVRRLFIRRYR